MAHRSTIWRRRKKWKAALLSGDYTQTQGRLMRDAERDVPAGFCCIGVGCDLFGLADAQALRSDAFAAYAAFRAYLGYVDDDTSRFIALNDTYGASFADIAKEINA